MVGMNYQQVAYREARPCSGSGISSLDVSSNLDRRPGSRDAVVAKHLLGTSTAC